MAGCCVFALAWCDCVVAWVWGGGGMLARLLACVGLLVVVWLRVLQL